MNIGTYRVGDNPAHPVTIDVDPDQDSDAYNDSLVTIRDSAGVVAASIGPVAFEGEEISLTIPAGTFHTPGIYTVTPVLIGAGMVTLEPLTIVVEEDTGWHSLASARALWPGGGPSDDAALYTVLEAAKAQCLAFAPAITGRPPLTYTQAQILQARALWNSGHVTQADQFGDDNLTVTVFPMDWTVKNLLRPSRAVKAFF